MLPADERLDADHALAPDGNDGLVEHAQLVAFQGAAQCGGGREPRPRALSS